MERIYVFSGLFRRPLQALVAMLLIAFSVAGRCEGQGNEIQGNGFQASEIQVKSAFLYKFINYVEWPPQSFQSHDSTLVIGVLGAEAIADNLSQLVASRAGTGRTITVKRLKRSDSLAGLHVLFIGNSENGHLGEILASTRGQALLTVTESEQALALGSVINFVVVDDKVRFDVSPPLSDPNNLKVSARLLAVARKVMVKTS